MGLFELLKSKSPEAAAAVQSAYSQLTPAEIEALKFKEMQRQMDELSRQNAFASNPQAVPYYQQTNPLGNTMTNVAPQGGGLSVQQPPMDLNALLRILGYR
jgi:predicted unusual protein kinase regulating ubiquinone biosynthesis (AarF/ABC1/UbiB family)